MGLGIIRIFKAFKGITDRYEATINCSKDFNATIDFIKKYQGKSLYRAGKLRVVSDVSLGAMHEIKLEVQAQNPVTKQVVKVMESIVFRINHNQNVATQITLNLRAVDSKATFEEFKKALAALPDVQVGASVAAAKAAPVQQEVIDLTDKTMGEALSAFEEAVNAFNENVGMPTFIKVKAIRDEINKKIKTLEPKEKAAFMSSMSKVDTFVNAINMQLSNPAMASSAATFAGTYVSQILSEIAQMQAMC